MVNIGRLCATSPLRTAFLHTGCSPAAGCAASSARMHSASPPHSHLQPLHPPLGHLPDQPLVLFDLPVLLVAGLCSLRWERGGTGGGLGLTWRVVHPSILLPSYPQKPHADHLGIISNAFPSNEQLLGYLWLDDRDPITAQATTHSIASCNEDGASRPYIARDGTRPYVNVTYYFLRVQIYQVCGSS
jgi:hypothetical protein